MLVRCKRSNRGSGGIEDGKKCEREIEEKEKREALELRRKRNLKERPKQELALHRAINLDITLIKIFAQASFKAGGIVN